MKNRSISKKASQKYVISLVSLVACTPEVRNARHLVSLVLNEAVLVEVDVVAAFARWFELDLVEDVLDVVNYDF